MDTITVINPWSKAVVETTPEQLTQSKFDGIFQIMDPEICAQIDLADDSNWSYWEEYTRLVGPEAAGVIWFS